MPDNQKVLSSDLKEKQDSYLFDSVVQRESRSSLISTIVFLLIGLSFIGLAYGLEQKNNTVVSELESIKKSQKNVYKKITSNYAKELKKKQTVINSISKEVTDINKGSYLWTKALDEVEKLTGPNVNISKISGHYNPSEASEEGANKMTIAGETKSFSSLASYIETIEKSEMFSDVNFKSLSKNRREGQPTKVGVNLTFSLNQVENTEGDSGRDKIKVLKSTDSISVEAPLAEKPSQPIWETTQINNAVSPTEGQIKLKWKENKKAQFYSVYMRKKNIASLMDSKLDGVGGKTKKVTVDGVKVSRYQGKVAKGSKEYEYAIKYIFEGGGSEIIKGEATSKSNKNIQFTWEDMPDVKKAGVYLAEKPKPMIDEDNFIDVIRGNEYNVSVEDPLQEYEFAVVAISKVGVQSDPSEFLVRTGGKKRDLQKITGVKLQRSPKSLAKASANPSDFKENVDISWSKTKDELFYAYRVYLGTNPDDLNLVATIKDREIVNFSKVFSYTPADLSARVILVDVNGNTSNK